MAAMLLQPRRPIGLLMLCRLALIGFVLTSGGFVVTSALGAPADYIIDTWGIEDNLPGSSVSAVTQTPDGYLWVGTYDGLARFDGLSFTTFDPGNSPALSHAR